MIYTTIFKKLTLFAATVALFTVGFNVLPSPPAATAATTGLCYDAYVGVTRVCPASSSEKVEGNADGKFAKDKCYVYNDPNKGWQFLDCNNSKFTDITTIPGADKIEDGATKNNHCPPELKAEKGGCDLIARYGNPLITFLTVAVGLIVTISIVVGGIQYGSARNNPQAITAAKTRITNALLGFLAYSLLWAFLQWMVPGGILK